MNSWNEPHNREVDGVLRNKCQVLPFEGFPGAKSVLDPPVGELELHLIWPGNTASMP